MCNNPNWCAPAVMLRSKLYPMCHRCLPIVKWIKWETAKEIAPPFFPEIQSLIFLKVKLLRLQKRTAAIYTFLIMKSTIILLKRCLTIANRLYKFSYTMDWSGASKGSGKKKIFIKTVELVKHEIAPSFFPSHRGRMLLATSDKKMRD